MENIKELDPIAPHSYPLWIQASIATCCLFFMICLTDLPHYLKLNNRIKKAEMAFKKRNFHDASTQYAELAFLLPNNKRMHLRAAESFFKSVHKEDHSLALSLLQSFCLKKDEWKELLEYMPEQYITMFEDKKAAS